MEPSKREQHAVLACVATERNRQDLRWGGPEHDDRHDVSDWIFYLRTQLSNLAYASEKAMDDEAYEASVRFILVKIAALAVAAIESHDRLIARLAEALAKPTPAEAIRKCGEAVERNSAAFEAVSHVSPSA